MSDKDHSCKDFNMFSTLEVSLRYNFDILFIFFFLANCTLLCEKITNKQTKNKQKTKKITVTFNTNLPSNSKH